ncbi:deoxyguanosinetriphosphate triphosphohydrolase [Thalassiella azotivora]
MPPDQAAAPAGDGYGPADRERWVTEPRKRPGRGDFARDRARVLHSSALRRLGAKTQVVGPGTDDFARTRLTHSLEVAQVGRELAAAFGCDPDVVDAACLAHDLGHPPFGHHGERVLDEVAAGIGGFEGNAQTLRLLTRLEPKVVDPGPPQRPAGLNLTRASLDAATKYPWRRGEAPDGGAKFGVYDGDLEVFRWLREGAPSARRSFEAQVMDLADDVAYSVHDVEDAVVGGWLDPGLLGRDGPREQVLRTAAVGYAPRLGEADLDTALERLRATPYWVHGFDGGRAGLAALKDMTSQLIGRFCAAAELATREAFGPGPLRRHAADVVVPSGTLAEIAVLKATAAVFVMRAHGRRRVYERQRAVVTELTGALVEAGPAALEPAYAADLRAAAEADDDAARLRTVVDQVSVLTDASAVAWHRRLCRPRRAGG